MRIIAALLTLLILIAGIAFVMLSRSKTDEQTLVEAETMLSLGQTDEALLLTDTYLRDHADSAQAYLVRAKVLLTARKAQSDFLEAYEALKAAVEADDKLLEAKVLLSDLTYRLGRMTEAEPLIREVRELEPANIQAIANLWQMMRLQGNSEALKPLFVAMVKHGQVDPKMLLIMADPNRIPLSPEDRTVMRLCMKTVPEDPIAMLGDAVDKLLANKPGDALPIFTRACEMHPQLLEAQGLLGATLLKVGSAEEIAKWLDGLPDNKDDNARIWWVRGQLAARGGDRKAAARCYWESLKLNPTDRTSAYDLGQALSVLGQHTEDAKRFSKHAADLANLGTTAFEAGPNAPEKVRVVVGELERLGRLQEALAWCVAASQIPSETDWATAKSEELRPKLESTASFMLSKANPANGLDLTDWPVPADESLKSGLSLETVAGKTPASRVTFDDIAFDVGMDFTFYTPINGLASMHEFSGGGVSVIDFDRDGWPDIYLTQGATFPPKSDGKVRIDRLYRNMAGQRFELVTDAASAGDTGYGQGAGIGDFDNDGFADIFVGNIGRNGLFHNNGDGTFSSVELGERNAGNDWTIGAVIADLNSDSIPDLYALNYLGGDDVFTRECVVNGRRIQCSPDYFPADADQVLFGEGSGRFIDSTRTSDLVTDQGKGMGIVAFRMKDDDKTSLLIANDTEPNYLFRSNGDLFDETGMLSGIALGKTGQAQSCMGIAAGDVNNDGALDFLVTNFTVEANNLFIQDDGFFSDEIDSSGLRDAGFSVMGWGAQFLDANLDGDVDLLIANGHLENRAEQVSKMPTHFFYNTGGRFELGKARQLGHYFKRSFFGRAVATLDWNCDGLPDAMVTHRNEPVALLSNTTATHGDFVAFCLVGTTSSRDAVGAVVSLMTSERMLVRQITAGDGFQASNQKQLLFGLNPDEEIESLSVRWPSGSTSSHLSVARNTAAILVESGEYFPLTGE